MEYEEIGKLLDMTAESVRKLVYRGLEKMRKHAGDIPILFLLTFFKKTVHKKFLQSLCMNKHPSYRDEEI